MYPLYILPCFLLSGFTSDFQFIIVILQLLTSYLTTCVLFHQSPALILLFHVYSLLDITCYLYLFLYACTHDVIFNACLLFGFIDTRVLIYARHLAFASLLTEEFCLTPLNPHVQVSELGACEFSQLLVRVAQLKRGSPVHRPEPYPSRPLRVSRVFLL